MIEILVNILFLIRGGLDSVFAAISIGGGGMTAGALLNFVLISIAGYLFITRRAHIRHFALWLPFIGISGLSILWSPFKGEAIRAWLVILTYFSTFVIPFYVIKNVSNYHSIIRIVVYSTIIPAMVGVANIIILRDLNVRIQSTFLHPNVFAYYLNLGLGVLILSKMPSIDRMHWGLLRLFVPYTLILIILEVFTQARAAWIGLSFLLLVVATLINRRLLVGIVFLPTLIFLPSVGNRLSDLTQGTEVSAQVGIEGINSYAWRQLMWQSALEDIADAPITGRGLASYGANALRFFPLVNPEDYYNPKGIGAHNTYIQVFYETGLFGAIGYIYLLSMMIIKCLKCRRYDRNGGLIFASLGVANMIYNYSDNMLEYGGYNFYFFGLMGAFLATRYSGAKRTVIRNSLSCGGSINR